MPHASHPLALLLRYKKEAMVKQGNSPPQIPKSPTVTVKGLQSTTTETSTLTSISETPGTEATLLSSSTSSSTARPTKPQHNQKIQFQPATKKDSWMDEADLMAVEACNLSGYKQEGGDGEKVKKDNVEKFKRTIG